MVQGQSVPASTGPVREVLLSLLSVIEPADPVVFLRDFLVDFFETHLLGGLVSAEEYQDLLVTLKEHETLADISRDLVESSPRAVHLDGFGLMRLIELREPDGSGFPFLQGLFKPSESRPKLTCFVGHRFRQNIAQSLRFNLVHLLSPLGIVLRWSGYDLSARDIFGDIISGIREADICVFDNWGTLNRPNVYIEIGIAYALGKPMLVCEYTGSTSGGGRRILDTGSVPSDLQGLFRIQYRSYEELCRQLYFSLPIFLDRHRLL